MRRVGSEPRRDWRDRVRSRGLTSPTTVLGDGYELAYWIEDAYYELTTAEVRALEDTTAELHGMCLEAAARLATGEFGDLGLAPGALELTRASLAVRPPSLLGRFDLWWDGSGPAKLLEYSADTPSGLLESALTQRDWLEDTHPRLGQWNGLHDRLVQAWGRLRSRLPEARVWFARDEDDPSDERHRSLAYLRRTCDEAGLSTGSLTIAQIAYDDVHRCFVAAGQEPMRTCVKLHPWDTVFERDLASSIDPDPDGVLSTTWLEPPWKALLSNKTLLAALWDMYPGHPNLLPAYLGSPRDLREWVAKPLLGRDGDDIRVHAHGIDIAQPGRHVSGGWCYQQWCPLPEFDGYRAVVGSWVIDGAPAGAGIRESDGWVTDRYSRFVPHVVTPAPSGPEGAG